VKWLAILALALGAWRQASLPEIAESKFISAPLQATSEAASQPIALREIARYDIPMPRSAVIAHAGFLLPDKQGMRAFWFAGQRESGEDVQIVMSRYTPSAKANQMGVWGEPVVVVNRYAASQSMGFGNWIRRLGNPVAWIDAQGRTHLYVVATGLGGWAASRILHLRQEAGDANGAFQSLGFLQLSPFFNLSHLVRGVPVPMQDGGVLLPAYFEMKLKYPVALRLDQNGELVQSRDAVVHMAGNDATLQPVVVARSATHATAYLRDNSESRKLRFVQTMDAGRTWATVPNSQGAVGEAGADWVINPDSSLAAVLVQGQTLLIHNPQTSGRHRLVIEASSDGLRGFKRLVTLEYEPEKLEGAAFNEYSYPSAVAIGKQLHVSYTYQRRFIRHVVFDIEASEGVK
jgi:predicted neuraminidase